MCVSRVLRIGALQESNINYEKESGKIPGTCIGKIEFKNVDFCYPTRKDVQIMKGEFFCSSCTLGVVTGLGKSGLQ